MDNLMILSRCYKKSLNLLQLNLRAILTVSTVWNTGETGDINPTMYFYYYIKRGQQKLFFLRWMLITVKHICILCLFNFIPILTCNKNLFPLSFDQWTFYCFFLSNIFCPTIVDYFEKTSIRDVIHKTVRSSDANLRVTLCDVYSFNAGLVKCYNNKMVKATPHLFHPLVDSDLGS